MRPGWARRWMGVVVGVVLGLALAGVIGPWVAISGSRATHGPYVIHLMEFGRGTWRTLRRKPRAAWIVRKQISQEMKRPQWRKDSKDENGSKGKRREPCLGIRQNSFWQASQRPR